MIDNYGSPYEKWNIFVARPHLWLQLGMVKPEITLCERVLNSVHVKYSYLLTNSLTSLTRISALLFIDAAIRQ